MHIRKWLFPFVGASILYSLASPFHAAVTIYTWTQEEIDCAASIGAKIGRISYDQLEIGPKTLTWISDLVIRGVVTDIRSDTTGPYHRNVYVRVTNILKGSETTEVIVVKLKSGPAYSRARGQIVNVASTKEPTFTVGEEVLLFLTKSYDDYPDDPERYCLGTAEYRLVPKGKYLVFAESGRLRNARYEIEDLSLTCTLQGIAETVNVQAASCE